MILQGSKSRSRGIDMSARLPIMISMYLGPLMRFTAISSIVGRIETLAMIASLAIYPTGTLRFDQ